MDLPDGRLKGVECRPDRRISDRVDHGGDTAGRGLRRERGKFLRGHPEEAASPVGRDRIEGRGRPRPERAVGKELEPADFDTPSRRTQRRATAESEAATRRAELETLAAAQPHAIEEATARLKAQLAERDREEEKLRLVAISVRPRSSALSRIVGARVDRKSRRAYRKETFEC